ncbi:MAG: 3D-(3,5/4)-trihydroxycyclohexane-1,2-dione acylhydrolase (decyclizing) [Chloroflexi bacterium]|nr:MAG: 3D-(3,5/4)-trihydroxycyclohexane-1,2-dione acylhydrolase (decyclizing) [Chloroflexota bacterium]
MAETERLTAAQAIVRFLAAQSVERDGVEQPFFAGMFGIFGHGNVAGLGEALEAAGDSFRYYQARNEQSMVHTAAGFAKKSRRLRAFACTTSIGPGATNLVTGAAAATVNRLPVLLLPGDLFASRRVAPVLQQLERADSQDVSVNDTLRPVSRYWDRINRPEQLITALPAAMRILTSPAETGAVTLALPQDVQAEAFDVPGGFLEPNVRHVPRPRPDRAALERAADAIAASRRPLVVVGGGVIYSDASEILDRFVRQFGLPVAETQAGKGALPWDHPLQVGPIGVTGGSAANVLAHDADLVLAIGTRLSDFTTASWTAWQDPEVRFVALNVAEFDAAKAAALPIVADARAGIEELAAALGARGWAGVEPDRRALGARLSEEWNAEVDRVRHLASPVHVSQPEAIRLVGEAAGPDDSVVCAAGSLPGDLHKLWRTTRPTTYHLEYGYSTMGYEIAGGLGVKLAAPEAEVFVMVGDGSYLMLSAEIATAVQEDRKLIIVLLENHAFQSIDNLSRAGGGRNDFNRFGRRDPSTGRLSGEPLRFDFAANARSLGADALVADDPASLAQALATARASRRTTVIVTQIDPSIEVPAYASWWDVPIAEVTASPSVRAARDDYVEHVATERRFV